MYLSEALDHVTPGASISPVRYEVVITGSLYDITRAEAYNALRTLGFYVSDSVTARTTALITNNPAKRTVKRAAAERFGTVVLNEQEFVNSTMRSLGLFDRTASVTDFDFVIAPLHDLSL